MLKKQVVIYSKEKMMPKCKALTGHLNISVDGLFLPCCRYNIQDDKKFSINDYTVEEYRNTDFYKTIISNMENGWDDGCSQCKADEERAYKPSMRQRMNKDIVGDTHIEYVEFSISNQCNITCRMCGPRYSSKWATIENVEIPKQNFNDIIEKIDWTHVKKIKYLGGEPFVTKEFKMLIDKLETLDAVELMLNTNCTLFPSKYIDKLKKLKKLGVALSIDGIGKVDEYIRQGTDWNTKLEVIKKWEDYQKNNTNCHIWIHTVVQAHNIHDMKNIKAFAESHNWNWSPAVINWPEEFQLQALDKEYINQIKDNDNSVFLNTITNYSADLNKKFRSTTERLDKLFNTRWEDIRGYNEKSYS